MTTEINKHRTLTSDAKFLTKYPRFGLVLVKPLKTKKLTEHPRWIGPALILARQVVGRNLFLLHLTSGKIMKKSYRQVRSHLNGNYYNLPLETRSALQTAYPLCLENGPSDPNKIFPEQGSNPIIDNFDKKQPHFLPVLKNILNVFAKIRTSLPNCKPTNPTIYTLDDHEDEDSPQTVTWDINDTPETEPTQEENTSEQAPTHQPRKGGTQKELSNPDPDYNPDYPTRPETEQSQPSDQRPKRNTSIPARFRD